MAVAGLLDQRQRPDHDIADYRNIIVAYSSGSPVHLSDVANLVIAPENTKLAHGRTRRRPDPERAAPARRKRHPGATPSTAASTVEADMPPALDIGILSDRTSTIRASCPMSNSSWCWP